MTNKIIFNRSIVDDEWQSLAADDAIPANGKIIVPLATWQAEREALLARTDDVGVQLNGDDDLNSILPDLEQLAVIALEFPRFADGRVYSYARLLSERHGYQGQIRAVGDVLLDQISNMHRCGFNAMQLREDKSLTAALERFDDYSVRYQSDANEALPLFRRRA